MQRSCVTDYARVRVKSSRKYIQIKIKKNDWVLGLKKEKYLQNGDK